MKIAHSFALFALVLSLFTGCNNKSANTIAYIDFSDFWDYSATNSNQMVQMWDQLHTTATLQGVVNRHSPKIYINYVKNEMMEADRFWWNYYRQEGRWLADRDTITYSNVVSLVEAFSDKIDGAVVYDSNIPSTSCVASAVAGVENLVAVRYDTSKGSLYDQIIVNGPKLEVKVWLVNSDGTSLFTGKGTIPQTSRESSGSLKNDPYIWFLENYMKKDKCSGEYGAYYLDQYWRQNPSAAPMNAHCLTNHDFFVSRKAFFFDLSPWADEAATDDPTQKIGTDFNTLIEMLKEAYRLNKGEKMCHIGGFPAWAYKYTQHAEGSHQDVATEWEFSRIISAYNAFKDADAIGYGAMANASFWQHFPTKQSYPQKWVTTEELTERGYLDANGKVNFNGRKFMIFYVGDYDASSWITSVLPHLWSDKVRGSLPLMWCVSPILERRAPMVLDYLRATASENDYFAAADNGAGYLMPGMLQEPRELSALPDGLEAWANHCRPFYEKWGLTISGFVIDGHAPALTDKGLECYASFSPNGIVPQKTPRTRLFGNMPILRSGWDLVQGPEQSAALIVDDIHKSPIPFAWYRDILKSPSWHKQIMDNIAKLDPNIELLDAPTFFELYRRWLKENPDAAAG
ncbi:MAG: hypothetical protein J6L01_00020, partial [Alistipes sp.]|nr:hypothetical protein [Alistipes sp.]